MAINVGNDAGDSYELEGRIPRSDVIDPKKLTGRKNPAFIYKWHPYRWDMIGGEWLPMLGELRRELGVNNVSSTGSMDVAKLEAQKRGWRFIDPRDLSDNYMREYDHIAGTAYLPKWIKPRMSGGRRIDKIDEDGYIEFLKELVATGVIPKPDPEFIKIKIDDQRQAVDSALGRATTPYGQASYDRQLRKLEAMEAAAARLFDEPKVKAKK